MQRRIELTSKLNLRINMCGALLVLVALLAQPAAAAVIFSEDFDSMTTGGLVGQNGWFQCIVPAMQTASCNDNCSEQDSHLAARSYHPGGVNALFCDGHVAFYTDSISLDIWQALATIAGGETIGEHEQ